MVFRLLDAASTESAIITMAVSLEMGLGPGIGEFSYIHLCFRIFAQKGTVKILNRGCTMMGTDKINNGLRKLVFPGQFNTLLNMINDDPCTLLKFKIIMRIYCA